MTISLERIAAILDNDNDHDYRTRRRCGVSTTNLRYLTDRERDVLSLVAQGMSNEAIADLLKVNARTVETHTSRIFNKLGLQADHTTHRRVLAVLVHLSAEAASA